jgi:hypothetical protein
MSRFALSGVGACLLASVLMAPSVGFAQAKEKEKVVEPERIAIECEDMQGVGKGGAGGWKFAKWGTDLMQQNTFGGHWSSRMANAMSDASDPKGKSEEVYKDVTVAKDGKYKVWAKFECPPFFNYPFGIKIVKLDEAGKTGVTVFDKIYGMRDGTKHYSFSAKPQKGDLYWSWGMDHDAAEGFETDLAAGKYRVVLYKAANAGDTGPRSVDAILITSRITDVLNPEMSRFPMLDDLQQLNHCYFRFTNTSDKPVILEYNHWSHRYVYFYQMAPAAMIRFYDADGKMILDEKGQPLSNIYGLWTKPIPPGGVSPWIDMGPTMTTENSSPFTIKSFVVDEKGAKVAAADLKKIGLKMDIALAPSAKSIVKTVEKPAGWEELNVLVMPDLHRPEGVKGTGLVSDVYAQMTRDLNALPMVGPMPSKLRIMAGTGAPSFQGPDAAGPSFPFGMDYAIALGVNTLGFQPYESEKWDAGEAYYKAKGQPLASPGGRYHHTKDPETFKTLLYQPDPASKKWPKEVTDKLFPGVKERFYYVSYGDEIGLPHINAKDPKAVGEFRAFLKSRKVDAKDLGLASLDEAVPLASFTPDALAGVGLMPTKDAGGKAVMPTGADAAKYKALYWWTHQFVIEQGCKEFREVTEKMTPMVGPKFKTSANLGGMHPFYWMHQASFIESFRNGAMTLAWSEDYDYTQPEASRLCVEFLGAYLRAGAKYHDTPMQMYIMPHYPGNSGRHLIQNVISLWGQGVKDIDWFGACPDVWSTENYIHSRGGIETGRAMRLASGMAGNVENALLPARTRQGRVALLLSEASDMWEVEGKGQYAVEPGSSATNAYQEERKAVWYALRKAGYLVDLLTENDVAEGRLKSYKAIYVVGQNLDTRCVAPIKSWVADGGTVVMTAGAARKDQYDQPLTELDALVGRTAVIKSESRFKGALRAKLELPFAPKLGKVKSSSGTFESRVVREDFEAAAGAKTLATFEGAGPAVVKATTGKGSGYYIGTLPGQAMLFVGMPKRPAGKGGSDTNPVHFEPETLDATAAGLLLSPLTEAGVKPDVVTGSPMIVANVLDGPKATVVTVNRLGNPPAGWKAGAVGEKGKSLGYVFDPTWPTAKNVKIVVNAVAKPSKVYTALKAQGVTAEMSAKGLVITLPELDACDVVVLEK